MCVNQKSWFWRRLWLKEISGNKTFLESWTMSTLVKELPWWLVASGHSQGTKGMTSGAEGQGVGQSTGGTQGYFPNPRNDNPPFTQYTVSEPLAGESPGCQGRAPHRLSCLQKGPWRYSQKLPLGPAEGPPVPQGCSS